MWHNTIWENKKLIRHSKEYYEWLLKAMNKRKLDEIWVAFTKQKFGMFSRERVEKELNI